MCVSAPGCCMKPSVVGSRARLHPTESRYCLRAGAGPAVAPDPHMGPPHPSAPLSHIFHLLWACTCVHACVSACMLPLACLAPPPPHMRRHLSAQELLARFPDNRHLHLFIASCHYYLQNYGEAEESAMMGPANPLQNRILFHVAHKQGDENKLMVHHQKLTDDVQDQLSLASIHYLRSHFQEVRLSCPASVCTFPRVFYSLAVCVSMDGCVRVCV